MEFGEFTIRLFAALGLGAAIGIERQWRQSLAGIRTYALVAAGAAMFVLMSLDVGDTSQTRVAAQVASGIGFLGAGVIMRDGTNVRGLTTAAGLWCAAAIGTIAGIGALAQATMATAAVLAANIILRPLKNVVDRAQDSGIQSYSYLFKLTCRAKRESNARALLLTSTHDTGLQLKSLASSPTLDLDRVELRAEFTAETRDDSLAQDVVNKLSLNPQINAVTWEVEVNEDSDGGDGESSSSGLLGRLTRHN